MFEKVKEVLVETLNVDEDQIKLEASLKASEILRRLNFHLNLKLNLM